MEGLLLATVLRRPDGGGERARGEVLQRYEHREDVDGSDCIKRDGQRGPTGQRDGRVGGVADWGVAGGGGVRERDAQREQSHGVVGRSGAGGQLLGDLTDNIDWQRFATNHVGTGATIATGVDATTSYIVGVMARNAAGNSAWVNSAATAYSKGG